MALPVLLAHSTLEELDPLAEVLANAGWPLERHMTADALLGRARRGAVAAVILLDALQDGSAFAAADKLAEAGIRAPVLVLARPGTPALAKHKAGAHPAAAYLERTISPDRVLTELRRLTRPPSGEHAVAAALQELATARPPTLTPARPPSAGAPGSTAFAEAQRRIRELEREKEALERELEKEQAEHRLALGHRDEMVRQLELTLEALTQDLSNAATGLAEQQDRAGQSETRLARVETENARLAAELARQVAASHELRRELSEVKVSLLAAELERQSAKDAAERALRDATEAEAERADALRALENARNAARGEKKAAGSTSEAAADPATRRPVTARR